MLHFDYSAIDVCVIDSICLSRRPLAFVTERLTDFNSVIIFPKSINRKLMFSGIYWLLIFLHDADFINIAKLIGPQIDLFVRQAITFHVQSTYHSRIEAIAFYSFERLRAFSTPLSIPPDVLNSKLV